MRISNRAIGYLSFLALFILFGGISYGMYAAHQNEGDTITVRFDELGSLQPEDQVTLRGYVVGTVGNIAWDGHSALVEIKFNQPLKFREGTQFNNVNYALMGQRRLEITPSRTGKVLPKDYIHNGTFEPGIAEALRLMENVNQMLVDVREMVRLFAEGDSSHQSLQEMYEESMNAVDALLLSAENAVDALQPRLNGIFKDTRDAGRTLLKVAAQADTAIQAATSAVNDKVTQAQDLLRTLNDGSTRLQQTIATLENSPNLKRLMETREDAEKFKVFVEKLDKFIAAINTHGLEIYDENGNPAHLITWKRTNIIGTTAREKARLRAEKGESLPDRSAK